MRAARVCAILIALAGVGWFAIGIRQAHSLDAATRLITPGARGVGTRSLTAAQRARARSLLSEAAFLYPGDQVRILRADLALDAGRGAQARQRLERLGREHPQNLSVWVALAGASSDSPATFRLAARHVRALVPVIHSR